MCVRMKKSNEFFYGWLPSNWYQSTSNSGTTTRISQTVPFNIVFICLMVNRPGDATESQHPPLLGSNITDYRGNRRALKGWLRGTLFVLRRLQQSFLPSSAGNSTKTCTPPDDDVISYASDLNIMRAGDALCKSAHTHTHTHSEGARCVCGQAFHLQVKGRTADKEELVMLDEYTRNVTWEVLSLIKLWHTNEIGYNRSSESAVDVSFYPSTQCALAELQIRDYRTQSSKKINSYWQTWRRIIKPAVVLCSLSSL